MKKMLIIGMALLIMAMASGCGSSDDDEILVSAFDEYFEERESGNYIWID